MLTKQPAILPFFFCFLASVALAQQAKRPLSLEDIEQLLNLGVSSTGIVRVIDDRRVNFEVTEDVKERLRKAGADASVIRTVEKAALEFARVRFEKEEGKEEVDVAKVQQLLKALGYDPGPADGIAGARTRDAIRSFQQTAGLQADGEISDDLVRRLTLEHQRKRLQNERKRAEEGRLAALEERFRLEAKKQRHIVGPSRPGDLPSSPTLPGYINVRVPKIASGAFTNELKNKKVKVLVSYFRVFRLNLPPRLANQFISFIAHGYRDFTSYFTVLVPKAMADKVLSLGQVVALYGQLVQLGSIGSPFGELVLVLDRIEPLHIKRERG